MRLDLRSPDRQPLFAVQVEAQNPPAIVRPPQGDGAAVALDWTEALDEHGHLLRCPACGCRELFVRKDFPQRLGLALVIAAAVASVVLFALHMILAAFVVLGTVVVIDAVVYLFTGLCVVCYRCRTEARDLPIRREQKRWDLATGEKYRGA
jgi:hypothetical protein